MKQGVFYETATQVIYLITNIRYNFEFAGRKI